MRLWGALGCVRLSVLRRCRCRLRSVGCGFWIGWRVAVQPTRCRWRFGCGGHWTLRRWKLRLGMLWSGTRACARCFRSEEHTSELQSHSDLVCRLLLEKKKKKNNTECAESRCKEQRIEFVGWNS